MQGSTQRKPYIADAQFNARLNASRNMASYQTITRRSTARRYDSYSGIAYSAAKNLDSMPIEWCSLTERRLPRPDVVMYLSIPTDLAHKRIGVDAERYECSDYLENVKRIYDRPPTQLSAQFVPCFAFLSVVLL